MIDNVYKEIYEDNSEFKIWKKLDNGCYIGTLGYSEKNILILQKLLLSFQEQYGEIIDYDAAREELLLYFKKGKLFIYFNEEMVPISMNGCVYNYDNETVDFLGNNGRPLSSIYFYGLSTLKEYRGRGACRNLISFVIEYAKNTGFDYVYARTDLTNSNSEWLMARAGLEVCMHNGYIIAEWVDVTEQYGDYRLHMWKPLHEGIYIKPKGNYLCANNDQKREIANNSVLKKVYSTHK